MHAFLVSAASVVRLILCVVVLLSTSRRMGAACARLPGLDVIVSLLTWVPWAAMSISFGWRGLFGALCGQLLSVFTWIYVTICCIMPTCGARAS